MEPKLPAAVRYIPIVVAVAVIVTAAVIQGQWSERWYEYPELKQYASLFPRVPLSVGDWQGEDVPGPEQKILDAAGAEASITRVYKRGADAVNISLVCGRVQDMFYHSPDRCYPAAGFEQGAQPINKEFETPVGPAEFKTATFIKSDPSGTQNRRIYWSWCATGKWEAPKEYKWTFGGRHAAFKLYVDVPAGIDQSADDNAGVDFIRVFVPALDKAFGSVFGKEDAAPAAKKVAKN